MSKKYPSRIETRRAFKKLCDSLAVAIDAIQPERIGYLPAMKAAREGYEFLELL